MGNIIAVDLLLRGEPVAYRRLELAGSEASPSLRGEPGDGSEVLPLLREAGDGSEV